MALTDDQLNAVAEACGNAVGFAFAAALREPEKLRSNAGLLNFAETLNDLAMDDKFSPDVTLVIYGLTAGVKAFALASPSSDEFI